MPIVTLPAMFGTGLYRIGGLLFEDGVAEIGEISHSDREVINMLGAIVEGEEGPVDPDPVPAAPDGFVPIEAPSDASEESPAVPEEPETPTEVESATPAPEAPETPAEAPAEEPSQHDDAPTVQEQVEGGSTDQAPTPETPAEDAPVEQPADNPTTAFADPTTPTTDAQAAAAPFEIHTVASSTDGTETTTAGSGTNDAPTEPAPAADAPADGSQEN